MSFASRRRLLMDRLHWAPTRGPKRRALLDELRGLVREELEREIAAAGEPPADLFESAADDAPPEDSASPEEDGEPVSRAGPYAREPYWVTQ